MMRLPASAHSARLLLVIRAAFWSALAVTFAIAEMPASRAPQLLPWDKAEHFLAFYVLTALAAAAYPRLPLALTALWLSLFGCTIELVQALPFVHRDCDVFDWVADVVAIAAAIIPMGLEKWRRLSLPAGG